MNNLLTGTSNNFTVIGEIQGNDDDYMLIAAYIGQDASPEDYAIVEAVCLDDTKNSNGWQVADLNKIETIGAGLNYDHSHEAKSNHGTVFAERIEGNKKIVKIAIDKNAPKNADILSDLKFKPFTSPALKVAEWADKKNQVVGKARLSHLSVVTDPAYGSSNRVISLAAEDETKELEATGDAYYQLGKTVHAENVTAAVRYAERKAGGYTNGQRAQAKNKYEAMNPLTLQNDILPMLKEIVSAKENNITSQKTVSAVTENSSITSVRRPAANPVYAANYIKKLGGENNA